MTRAEHLMTIAAEESVELAQRVTKAMRFGMDEVQPGQILSNRERIVGEYADVVAAMEMLGIVDVPRDLVDLKRDKVEHFLRYSETCGTLDKEEQ